MSSSCSREITLAGKLYLQNIFESFVLNNTAGATYPQNNMYNQQQQQEIGENPPTETAAKKQAARLYQTKFLPKSLLHWTRFGVSWTQKLYEIYLYEMNLYEIYLYKIYLYEIYPSEIYIINKKTKRP